mgnify:CR=1 FL=1
MREHHSRRVILKRIVDVSFMHPVLMFLTILLAVISALSYFVPYLVILFVIRSFFDNSFVISPELVSEIAELGLAAVIGASVNVISFYASLICSHVAAFESAFELRKLFAAHIYKLPMGFHISEGSGKLKGVMYDNVDRIQSFIAHKIPDLVSGIIYPAAMIVLMLIIDWRLGLPLILGIVIAYVFYFRSMGHGGTKHMMELYFDALADLDNASVEYARGITVTKIFGINALPKEKFCQSAKAYSDMAIPYTKEWEKYMCWFEALMRNLYLFLIPAIIILAAAGGLKEAAPDLLFYLILTPSLATVIPKIGNIMDECMRVNEEIVRVDNILKRPAQLELDTGAIAGAGISFKNVGFSYTEKGQKKALENISFEIEAGSRTAIIGASGSGKSTIAALLARFWDVDSGNIFIGATDIRNVPMDELMDNISFVFQNDYMFADTIRNNLTMGREISEEKIIEAAKAAHCHDFIMELPDSYDTNLSLAGVHLSGGEKQRIFIARAILKDSPIIVLDEATASLDSENEWMIREGLDRLGRGKTVLVIAHRLNMTKDADQILVMKEGAIVERGSHSQLLVKGSYYKKMWESWKRIREWKIV